MDDKNQIDADRDLIEAHGGPAKLAEKLAFDKAKGGVQRVQNWLTRGIPAHIKLEHPDIFLAHLTSGQHKAKAAQKP